MYGGFHASGSLQPPFVLYRTIQNAFAENFVQSFDRSFEYLIGPHHLSRGAEKDFVLKGIKVDF